MTDKRNDHGRRDDAPDKTVDADDLDPSPDTEPDLPAGPIETEEDTSVRESLSDFGATLSTLVRSYAATMHTLVRDHALPWLGDQARNARSLPKRAKRRVILFAVGPSNTIGTRVGAIVMLVATAALAGAGFLAVASGVDAGGDSSWFMEQLVGAATSVWSYALVLLLLFAVIRVTQRSRAATKAASRTGFSEQTCHRLASEAQTADGASTVVVSPADSVDTACDRILSAFETPYSALDINWGIRTSSTTISSRPPRRAQRRPRKPTLWSTTVRTWTRANTRPPQSSRTGEHAQRSRPVLVVRRPGRRDRARRAHPRAVLGRNLGVRPHLCRRARRRVCVVRRRALLAPPPREVRSVDPPAGELRRHCRPRQEGRHRRRDVLLRLGRRDRVRRLQRASPRVDALGGGPRPYRRRAHPADDPAKFARNLTQYLPNLEGYEEAVEKAEIRDRLIQEVAESPSARLPKNRLADRVIRRDKERIGGIGYDPRLVAEAYGAVVPYALVEEHVDVETPTEGTKSMSVVRLRTEHVTPEAIATDAQFSSLYQPDYSPDFDLPAVDLHAPRRRCPTERRAGADRGFSHSYP